MSSWKRSLTLLAGPGAGLLLAMIASLPASLPAGAAVAARSTAPPNVALNAVDCVSVGNCMAVGQVGGDALAQRWNGSTWTVLKLPGIEKYSSLVSVSCASSRMCVAVGWRITAGHVSSALAEEWNGTAWREMPSAGQGVSLASVSCASTADCITVGLNQGFPIALKWNGHTWSVSLPPYGGGPITQMGAVTCLRATFCMTVGEGWIDNEFAIGFAGIWNGTSWGDQMTLLTSAGEPTLSGVSCTSGSDCVTVGGLAAHWDGSTWTLTSFPAPKKSQSFLNGISCPVATDCIAVGTAQDPTTLAPVKGFADRWNGSAWRLQPTASPGAPYNLNAVSCTSASRCLAVGSYLSGQIHLGLTEIWNGHAWRIPTGQM